MSQFFLSHAAGEDMFTIWKYIAADNSAAADAHASTLREAMQRIAQLPGIGRSRVELEGGLYSFPIGNYIIFYTHRQQGGIEIYRIFHRRMDISKQF